MSRVCTLKCTLVFYIDKGRRTLCIICRSTSTGTFLVLLVHTFLGGLVGVWFDWMSKVGVKLYLDWKTPDRNGGRDDGSGDPDYSMDTSF